ncbi:hypothetical protein ACQZ6E_25685, partial [Agrobacterium vitis]
MHVQLFDRTSLGQAASSRNGWVVNPKRIYRLYNEMDLQLRNKVPKRRVKAKLRSHRTAATRSNDVW